MFEHCRAFVFASHPHDSRVLELIAHHLGFGEVASGLGDSATGTSRAAVTYLFVDYQLPDDVLQDVIEAVRSERSTTLCYSPIILFTDECGPDMARRYVHMGFDDVIGLPEQRDVLAERLSAQLHSRQVYFDTEGYFGPDRRRLDHGSELRVGISPYTRLVFQRDPRHGIRVLERQQRGHRFRPRPSPGTHFMPKLFGHPTA